MKKYIVLQSVDDKGFLPLNKQGYKLDNTAVSTIDTLNKKTNIVKDLFIDSIDVLANISDASVKLFKNVKGVILNKTVSYPNNKIMVKYELANEIFNCGIHLILWNNDLLIKDNYLYTEEYFNDEISQAFEEWKRIIDITSEMFLIQDLHIFVRRYFEMLHFRHHKMLVVHGHNFSYYYEDSDEDSDSSSSIMSVIEDSLYETISDNSTVTDPDEEREPFWNSFEILTECDYNEENVSKHFGIKKSSNKFSRRSCPGYNANQQLESELHRDKPCYHPALIFVTILVTFFYVTIPAN